MDLFRFDLELFLNGKQLSTTKTRRPYVIPIHPALREKLQALCIATKPEDFVSTYEGRRWGEAKLGEIWNEAAGKAGLKLNIEHALLHI